MVENLLKINNLNSQIPATTGIKYSSQAQVAQTILPTNFASALSYKSNNNNFREGASANNYSDYNNSYGDYEETGFFGKIKNKIWGFLSGKFMALALPFANELAGILRCTYMPSIYHEGSVNRYAIDTLALTSILRNALDKYRETGSLYQAFMTGIGGIIHSFVAPTDLIPWVIHGDKCLLSKLGKLLGGAWQARFNTRFAKFLGGIGVVIFLEAHMAIIWDKFITPTLEKILIFFRRKKQEKAERKRQERMAKYYYGQGGLTLAGAQA